MSAVSYDNIDLFYYHSIDIDFARLYSILNYGIVSKNIAQEKNIEYYYRNYTHSSSRDDFICVNHFPRTIFRYYKIENELYDFNANKICFIIDDVDALEKQVCNKRMYYTNERHILNQINLSQIKGILIREVDAKKSIQDIAFNYKYTDQEFFENKVFLTISFFRRLFGSFINLNQLYFLIGKLRGNNFFNQSPEIIMELISKEMRNSINLMLSSILKKEYPTLLDVVSYINNDRFPIYIMNRYDIKKAGCDLKQTDDRLIRFEFSGLKKQEMKANEKVDKKILKLLRKMSMAGLNIYINDYLGPLDNDDAEIVREVKQLQLKKNN